MGSWATGDGALTRGAKSWSSSPFLASAGLDSEVPNDERASNVDGNRSITLAPRWHLLCHLVISTLGHAGYEPRGKSSGMETTLPPTEARAGAAQAQIAQKAQSRYRTAPSLALTDQDIVRERCSKRSSQQSDDDPSTSTWVGRCVVTAGELKSCEQHLTLWR